MVNRNFILSLWLCSLTLGMAGCLSPHENPISKGATDLSLLGEIGGTLPYPQRKILLLNQETGVTETGTTDSEGHFRLRLQSGIYSLLLVDDSFLTRHNLLEKDLVVKNGVLTTVVNVRTVPVPLISSVGVASRAGGFTVTFDSDVEANSFVEFGLSVAYGSTSPIDLQPRKSHSISVTGLDAGKTYHLRIICRRRNLDAAQFTSQDFTVTPQ